MSDPRPKANNESNPASDRASAHSILDPSLVEDLLKELDALKLAHGIRDSSDGEYAFGPSASESSTSSDIERRRMAGRIPHVEGFFNPPGGCNAEPAPCLPFGDWPFCPPLPPSSVEFDIVTQVGKPGTVVDRVVDSVPGVDSSTARQTPSPPPAEANETRTQLPGPTGGAFSTPTEVSREMLTYGPPNPWRPYNTQPDSRYKHPFGSLFPEPKDGWSETNNEHFDFTEAVIDWWENPAYSKRDLKTWVSDALWAKRQNEKIEWWVQFKAATATHVDVDLLTVRPAITEVVMKGREKIEDWIDPSEKQKWRFREIEPGESSDPKSRGRLGELVRPRSMCGTVTTDK